MAPCGWYKNRKTHSTSTFPARCLARPALIRITEPIISSELR